MFELLFSEIIDSEGDAESTVGSFKIQEKLKEEEYFNGIAVLEEKLIQKNKELIKKELDERIKELNKKLEEVNKRIEDRKIFKAKKRKYKTISTMLKRLMSPLLKVLRKYYKVEFIIETKVKKENLTYFSVSWRINFGPYKLVITLPDSQDCFDLYLKDISCHPNEYFEDKADLPEDSLRAKIKEVFIDHINSQE